ncbi:MAG TPA: PPC domain-containing protein [Gemmataceae bacterium]|jgi:hypothetical protein|nr:PPC domain-containing protein [Gemmataceae bacterium]
MDLLTSMHRHLPLVPVLVGLCLAADGRAQNPPAVTPDAQAPVLAALAPDGVQRGTALELVLTGTNLSRPTTLWTSFPAKVTIPADGNNGKDNARLRVRLEVPKDAPIGFQTVRLATARGLSNFRLFCIDDLPQVQQASDNHSRDTPQAVPVPAVVAGQTQNEHADYYKVSLKAGQRVSFDVLGRRLGHAIDPEITLYDLHTHKQLPGGHSNDAPGLQTDARLTYTFEKAGEYLLEVRDVLWRGGAGFRYRLRVGDFPCATTPIPMGARRGSKVALNFAGPAIEGVAPVEVQVPADPAVNAMWVAPRGANGLYGWPVVLAVSDLEELVEKEPNDEPAKANRMPVPGAITGRFEKKGDADHFVFAAKKGQRYAIVAQTLELSSPTAVDMVLKNSKGAKVGETNPALPSPADQVIDFTAPKDGDYVLAVQHLNGWGGPAESYRLTVRPAGPDFSLSLGIDRYGVPQGGSTAVSVLAARTGYAGPIEVTVVGPAGVSGKAVIAAGQPAAPNVPAVLLTIHARPDVAMGAYPITIQGKATIDGKPVVRYASVSGVVRQSLGNLPYPPPQLFRQVGLAVTQKPPFSLAAKFDRAEWLRGGAVTATITGTRDAGFDEPITLTAVGLPPNVPPAAANIAKGQKEVKVQLNPAANAPLGRFLVSFVGKARFEHTDFAVTAPPVPLVLVPPFDLKLSPASLPIAQGGKAKLKVKAVRRGGYQGPVALELRNLPANVTATKAVIDAGHGKAVLEVAAAANAAVASKADIKVVGTATAAGNQQAESPNITLSVTKPGAKPAGKNSKAPPQKPKPAKK